MSTIILKEENQQNQVFKSLGQYSLRHFEQKIMQNN